MSEDIASRMKEYLDNLTKPVGSLGDLEDYAIKLSQIQGRVPPVIEKRAVFVFAGDHGVTEEKVSLYPKEVTSQMMLNILNGGAAINVLARHCGFDTFTVDAGVAGDFNDQRIINRKVGHGTKNISREAAMTEEELEACLSNGREMAEEAVSEGYDLVAIGDMGIGNTTSAAALLVAAGFDAEEIIDRGTGISSKVLSHKKTVIQNAVRKHAQYDNPRSILKKLGGFELGTMTGFILGLRGKKIACVIDGFPVTSAAYLAYMLDKSIISFLFAGHKSKVKGHAVVLKKMGLRPVLDLNMRLGEGTGAVIGGRIIDLAVKAAAEMASFQSANVSRSEGLEENY